MNDGELYAKYNKSQRLDAEQILEEFSSLFEWKNDGSDSLLDVGCGPGDVLIDLIIPKIPRNFKIVVGIDISRKMIECAKSYETESIKFYQMDIAGDFELCKKNLGEEVKLFDNITSFYCQHWIQDQRQALSNIKDFLRPSGKVLMTFIVSCPIFDIYESLSKFSKYKDFLADWKQFVSPYHNHENPIELFTELVTIVGLKVQRIELRHKTFFYESVDQLKNAVQSVNPFSQRMPQLISDEFLEDYMKLAKTIIADFKVESPNDKVVSCYTLIIAVLAK